MKDTYSATHVRRSFFAFVAGKLASGLLGFLIFLALARLLDRAEFGALVALMAFSELVIGISILGLDWILMVHIPAFRIGAGTRGFWRFTLRMVVLRGLILGLACAGVAAVSAEAARMLGLERWAHALYVYLGITWLDGMLRYARDQLLDSLLMQGASQASYIAKNIVLASFIGAVLADATTINLDRFVVVDLAANGVAALVVVVAFLVLWLRDRRDMQAPASDWTPPTMRQLVETARNNYGTSLMQILSAPGMVALAIERQLGIGATAAFGFARTLAEQARRYLPSELFQGILRTVIVADHARKDDLRLLAMHHALMLKTSCVPVAILIGVLAAYGKPIVAALGGAKYADSELLVIAFFVHTALFVIRRNLELYANVARRTSVMVRGTAFGLASVPAAVAAMALGGGLLAVAAAVIGSELLVISAIAYRLGSTPDGYRLPVGGLTRVFGPAIVVGFAYRLLLPTESVAVAAVSCVSLAALSLAAIHFARPFDADEQSRLERVWRSVSSRGRQRGHGRLPAT